VTSEKTDTRSGFRIVVADDHFPDVVLAQEALRAHGVNFQMDIYHDGDAVVRRLVDMERLQDPPDLVILDLNLSRLGGLEVLREIRERPIFDTTPVAMLTSFLSPAKRAQAMQLKADAFISKPTHLEEFLSQVGTALSELLNRKSGLNAGQKEHETNRSATGKNPQSI
jgi:DNA-binding response OmpR family regulator